MTAAPARRVVTKLMTLAHGLKNRDPETYVVHPWRTADDFADVLMDNDEQHGREGWVAHVFDGRRAQENWLSASFIQVDIDHLKRKRAGATVPETERMRWATMISAGVMPGSMLHATWSGFRVFFCLNRAITDVDRYKAVVIGAQGLVRAALASIPGMQGYEVDAPASGHQALSWLPITTDEKDRARMSDICMGETDLYSPDALAPASKPPTAKREGAAPKATSEDQRKAAWALERLSPGVEYHDWRDVCSGVVHAFNGSDEGLALFDLWSQGGKSYDEKAVVKLWRSLEPGGGITVASIIKQAQGQERVWEAPPEARALPPGRQHTLEVPVPAHPVDEDWEARLDASVDPTSGTEQIEADGAIWEVQGTSVLNPETGGSAGEDQRAVVNLTDLTFSAAVEATIAGVAALKGNALFQRQGMLVAMRVDPDNRRRVVVSVAKKGYVACIVDRAVRYERFDGRSKRIKTTPLPRDLLAAFCDQPSWRGLRELRGVITAPMMREDGTVLDKRGYDPSSRYLFRPGGQIFPSVPDEPSREESNEALDAIREPFAEFPFKHPCDESAVLALLLTIVARRACGLSAPVFCVTAPVAGTGKSLIGTSVSAITTGSVCAPVSLGGEEETVKTLLGLALRGSRIVFLDNLERPLGDKTLAAVVTSGKIEGRMLGTNSIEEYDFPSVFIATGNNLKVRRDFGRRVVRSEIDAKQAMPDMRSGFDIKDLTGWCLKEHPRLVTAALTFLRGYIAAGKPKHDKPTKGSFETWDRLVRGALIWAGLDDPCANEQVHRARTDVDMEQQVELLEAWSGFYPDAVRLTMRDILRDMDRAAEDVPLRLRHAIGQIADLDKPRSVATKLGFRVDRVAEGLVLKNSKPKGTSKVWWVERT